ncbi:MAG: YHS domain-containing protein [Terriglobales bacterium]
MQTDPVCGMPVEEKNAAGKSEYKGQQFYFCSMDCKQQFDRNPEQYARKPA